MKRSPSAVSKMNSNCTHTPAKCEPVCPLGTRYRTITKILNGTNNCPDYQYFKTRAEVAAWSGDRVCCCTLWCNSPKAWNPPLYLVFYVLAFVASLIVSIKIFRKVKHRLENIPFLLGQYLYSPPLIAKYRCPYSLKPGTNCPQPWFFTLEGLYHHCNVEHNVVDAKVVNEECSKHLVQPKIIRGPEEQMFHYSGLIVFFFVYLLLISPFILVFVIFLVVKSSLAGSFCLSVDGRGNMDEWMLSLTIFAILFGALMALFAFERWETRNWVLDGTVKSLFIGSFFVFFCTTCYLYHHL